MGPDDARLLSSVLNAGRLADLYREQVPLRRQVHRTLAGESAARAQLEPKKLVTGIRRADVKSQRTLIKHGFSKAKVTFVRVWASRLPLSTGAPSSILDAIDGPGVLEALGAGAKAFDRIAAEQKTDARRS